jgi:NADPH:quinone reductase-like Zn-dependent oxidoreductase
MMAIVHDAYGTVPDEVLRLKEMDKPTIADEQVLVRVHAASVDRGTWHIMAGLPYPIRVAGFGFRKPKYLNPGRSLAGTIEAVGNNVTGFQPGEAVFGICDGSFAQYVGVRTLMSLFARREDGCSPPESPNGRVDPQQQLPQELGGYEKTDRAGLPPDVEEHA